VIQDATARFEKAKEDFILMIRELAAFASKAPRSTTVPFSSEITTLLTRVSQLEFDPKSLRCWEPKDRQRTTGCDGQEGRRWDDVRFQKLVYETFPAKHRFHDLYAAWLEEKLRDLNSRVTHWIMENNESEE
jgi:hypothetical protein